MKTVFVSGCYDVIHGGHIEFFGQARQLGDRLVVCIPSDRVLQAHKHCQPTLSLAHRLAVVAAIRLVDLVIVGDDPEPGLNFKSQFAVVKPDILAVTEDDRFEEAKRALCAQTGADYVKLPKTLPYVPVTGTQIRHRLSGTDTCPNCGGTMVGDGYTLARHCEHIEAPEGAEPDSGPWHCQAHLERLLAGIQALVQPHYASLNEHAGRNDRLLHAVLCAYAKHQLDCQDITWNWLGTVLHNAICNEIGDSAYVAWAESIQNSRL